MGVTRGAGFEVVVGDAFGVGFGERVEDLTCDVKGFSKWNSTFFEAFGERGAFDEFHVLRNGSSIARGAGAFSPRTGLNRC